MLDRGHGSCGAGGRARQKRSQGVLRAFSGRGRGDGVGIGQDWPPRSSQGRSGRREWSGLPDVQVMAAAKLSGDRGRSGCDAGGVVRTAKRGICVMLQSRVIDFDGRSWRPQKARVLPDGFNAEWCEPRCFTSDRILNLMKIDRTEPGWFSVQFSVSKNQVLSGIADPATPTQKSMTGIFVTGSEL